MKKRLFRRFALAYLVPVVLITAFHMVELSWVFQNHREKVSTYVDGIVDGMAQSVELSLLNMMNAAKTFSYSTEVQAMSAGVMEVSPVAIKDPLTMAKSYNPRMMDVMLTDRGGRVYGLTGYLKSSVEERAEALSQAFYLGGASSALSIFSVEGGGNPYLLYCMPVFSTQISAYYGQKVGAVSILAGTDDLLGVLNTADNVMVELWDTATGQVVLRNRAARMGEDPDLSVSGPGVYTAGVPGTTLVVRGLATDVDLDAESSLYATYATTSVVFTLVLCVYLALVVAWLFLRPIRRLNAQIAALQSGDGTQRLENIPDDEIGSIGRHLNSLLDTIHALNSKVAESRERLYQMDILKKKTQLYAYQSQINPHFLYNMLQCMRGIAVGGRMMEIADICTAMARIFRYSIKGESLVTLETELEYTALYLNMLRVRFRDRVRYQIDVPARFADCVIPKLTLQPLVENAVFHGLAARDYEGEVSIRAAQREGILLLTIRNDGDGIPPEKLREINGELEGPLQSGPGADEDDHIGILNVHNKIRLAVGMEYGLTLFSDERETVVTVRLPLERGADEPLPPEPQGG